MDLSNVLLGCLAGLGAMTAAFWLALIIWTFRDMRARSRDIFAQILAALLVAVLFLPGWVIYWMLRPKETLAEAYERSLEEEALLQGIEEALVCPGCGTRVNGEFVVCPNCHTKLKKSCQNCGRALNLRWGVCPYCGTPSLGGVQLPAQPQQPVLTAGDTVAAPALRRAQRAPLPEPEPVVTPEPPSEPQADAS
jgi:RNA polymerase subunit RPABC4/transcription elongation factor Spt4